MKRSTLKIFGLLCMLLMLPFFTSCEDEEERIPDLSGNPEAREEVYEQILSDEELLSEFFEDMGENDMAMESFSNNAGMRNRMYSGNRMHQMMRNNPQMRDSIMHGMMMGMEGDTTMQPTPQMRERMLQHIGIMVQRDSTFARELREWMNDPANAQAGTN